MKIHNHRHYTAAQLRKKILDKLNAAGPELPASLDFYRHLLVAQSLYRRPDLADDIAVIKKQAQKLLRQSKPLLDFSDIHLNWDNIMDVVKAISAIAVSCLNPYDIELNELQRIGTSVDHLIPKARAWFTSGTVQPKRQVGTIDNLMPLSASVLQGTMQPVLTDYADELLALVEQNKWLKAYCPVCGGRPDFAYLSNDSEGSRWLICSRCDAHWLYYLSRCPFCSNSDVDKLTCYSGADAIYRLYTCEQCKRYIKAIDFKHTRGEILLPMERVLTLDLDRQAIEKGYHAE